MSNVIQFLETMGKNAALSPIQYATAVAGLDIDADQRRALLDRNHQALSNTLGGRSKMMCLILPPDEEPAPVNYERQ
ncbi:hypothetical protein [Lysobacter fragariae]